MHTVSDYKTHKERMMLFKTSHAKNYLAASIIISLLQGLLTFTPVFAESVMKDSVMKETPADHSAEFKPVRNEFLREGEGLPGNQVPYYKNTKPTKEEIAEEKALLKEITCSCNEKAF